VYIVVSPLVVCVGTKDPQAVDPHRTVQFTPAFVVSLFSAARIDVVAFTCSEEGGEGANSTEMGSPPIVRVTLENLVGLLVEEAYRVTVPFFGGAAGVV
jgi:hypothetical protein